MGWNDEARYSANVSKSAAARSLDLTGRLVSDGPQRPLWEPKPGPGLGSHARMSGLVAVTRNIAAWCVRGDAE